MYPALGTHNVYEKTPVSNTPGPNIFQRVGDLPCARKHMDHSTCEPLVFSFMEGRPTAKR